MARCALACGVTSVRSYKSADEQKRAPRGLARRPAPPATPTLAEPALSRLALTRVGVFCNSDTTAEPLPFILARRRLGAEQLWPVAAGFGTGAPSVRSFLHRERRRDLKNSRPAAVRDTSRFHTATSPASTASSQTGSLGHEVRHALITSSYRLGVGPIHSKRSRTSGSLSTDILNFFAAQAATSPPGGGARLTFACILGRRPSLHFIQSSASLCRP